MADVKKLVLVEFPAPHMFDLVDRVEEYPMFLPWCGGAAVLDRTDTKTVARVHVSYHGVKAHFTTENDKHYPRHMLIRLREGPFTHLEGTWDFTPLGEVACKIEFSLRYEFSHKILEKALGPVFHHIANTLVDSFVKRAGQVSTSGRES